MKLFVKTVKDFQQISQNGTSKCLTAISYNKYQFHFTCGERNLS